jgi:hypothetical protein
MSDDTFDVGRAQGALQSQRGEKPKIRRGPLAFPEDNASEISKAVTFYGKDKQRLFRLSHADTLLFTSMMAKDHTDPSPPLRLDD